MNCTEAERMVRRYIYKDLSYRETQEFLEHIRECSKCREELETSFYVHQAIIRLNADEDDESMDLKAVLDEDLEKTSQQIILWRFRTAMIILVGLVLGILTVGAAFWVFFK